MNIVILNEFYDISRFLKLTAMANLWPRTYIYPVMSFYFLVSVSRYLKKKKERERERCVVFQQWKNKYGMECYIKMLVFNSSHTSIFLSPIVISDSQQSRYSWGKKYCLCKIKWTIQNEDLLLDHTQITKVTKSGVWTWLNLKMIILVFAAIQLPFIYISNFLLPCLHEWLGPALSDFLSLKVLRIIDSFLV